MSVPASSAADLRWLNNAEHWGEWIRFSETELTEPERIYLLSGANGNARFYAVGKGQIGPEHKGIYPAACWGWGNRWFWTNEYGEIDDIGMQLECRRWVLAGGASRQDGAA